MLPAVLLCPMIDPQTLLQQATSLPPVPWLGNALSTVLVVAGALLLRWFLASRIRRAAIRSPELRQRWLVSVRNGCFLLVVLGLVIVWSAELQRLAISLIAILVAIVLATKELILCLTGSFLKMRSGAFAIGDRIVVSGLRGDVVDQTLLTTRIAELSGGPAGSQYTGNVVTIPNSVFLTGTVSNASALGSFVLHTVVVPCVRESTDVAQAEKDLLDAAGKVVAPYLEEAREAIDKEARRQGLEAVDAEPRVTILLPDPARVDLSLRFAVPARQTRKIEQEILRTYLATQKNAPAQEPAEAPAH